MSAEEMKRVELISDRIAAARLDRRRTRELQRQERVFNANVRTIGVSPNQCFTHFRKFSLCP